MKVVGTRVATDAAHVGEEITAMLAEIELKK